MAQGNRIYVNTATTGQGTLTLGAVVSAQFNTFANAGLADGDQIRSYILEEGTDFEIGVGIYNVAGPTLTRVTVRLSRIAGVVGTTKMTLAGAATVRVIAAKEDLVTQDTSGNVAIGAALTADAPLTINSNTVASVAPGTGTALHLVGADAVINAVIMDAYGVNGGNPIKGRSAGGTSTTKTATVAGNALVSFQGLGWNTSSYIQAGQFQVTARETFSVSANGASMSFFTTPLTTLAFAEAMRIQPSGGVSVGAAAIAADPGIGSFNASANIISNAYMQTGGYTVATLPTPSSANKGAIAYVTDALTPSFLTIVVGGGTTITPVFCNGTNWVGG